ncbi:MAG: lipid-transfer protein [Streptosporangiales bacterium]|nr:lipid-transfer protein [Streptosporangiales bacterium]
MALTPGAAAIAGIGHTEFSKNSGRSELQLASEAVRAAIADAGLTPADVDGVVTMTVDVNDELALMRSVGIEEISWASRTPFGGGGSCALLQNAAAAVTSGAANAVVIYRAFNERSATRFGQPNGGGQRQGPPPGWSWYLPFGLDTPAKIYSLWYQRYMDAYGLTNEDFGRYTVVARKNAATNPNAWFYKRPITLEDHQNSRWIVEPILRLLDCCQESDGGVALVVTTAERAKDLKQPLVTLEAATQGHNRASADVMFNYYDKDLSRFSAAEYAARQLYGATGLTPADIDAAMIYENFSPVVFLQLEAFGFCGAGEAAGFIKDGHIEIGSTIPVNPHGGLLGEAYIHGVNNVIEGVRQLRGTAANQVSGASRVLAAAGHSALILGNGN